MLHMVCMCLGMFNVCGYITYMYMYVVLEHA